MESIEQSSQVAQPQPDLTDVKHKPKTGMEHGNDLVAEGGVGNENDTMKVEEANNGVEVGGNTVGEETKLEGAMEMGSDEPELSSEEQMAAEDQLENENTPHTAEQTAGSSSMRIEITQAPDAEETMRMDTDEHVADTAHDHETEVASGQNDHVVDAPTPDAKTHNSAEHVGTEVKGPPYHNPLGLPQTAINTPAVKMQSPKRPARATRTPSPQKPRKEPVVKGNEGGKSTQEKKEKGRKPSAPLLSQTLIVKLKGEQTGRMVIPVQKNKRGRGVEVGDSEEETDEGEYGGHDSEETEEDESSSKVTTERKSQKRTPGPTLIGPDGRQLRRKKPKKDPAKPKRPLPPFMYYSKAMRKSYITSNPNKSLVEITQLIGESWAALPEGQKQYYFDMSMRDKQRYTTEMSSFKKTENFPCGVCKRQVGDGEKAIMCEFGCQNWFHQSCSGLTEETYKLVAHEPMAAWMCNNCYAERKTKRKSPKAKPASAEAEATEDPAEE